MPQVQILRAFVQQRLTAAAEEIFELFERTIAEYEETLCRQGKLLDAVFKPQVRLQRTDGQLILVTKEEVPLEQQDWRPSLDQDVPQELPNIKEELEERWTRQQGEQLQGLEGPEITKFTFTPVPVKREEAAEEKPQPPRLHRAEGMKTEADGQDRAGPEPVREFNPDSHLQPDTDDEMNSSEPETDGSCDWDESSGRQSGLSPKFNTSITPVRSSECASSFGHEGHQQEHSGIQTGGKTFNCPVCGKEYPLKKSLSTHMRLHSAGKSFSCPFCQKTFPFRAHFVMHMRVHTGEKPFSCSVCDTKFTVKANLRRHMRTHTGEKPFTCNVCVKSFTKLDTLRQHKCAGESSGSK